MPFYPQHKEGSSASVDLGLPGTLDNCWFLVPEDLLSIYLE